MHWILPRFQSSVVSPGRVLCAAILLLFSMVFTASADDLDNKQNQVNKEVKRADAVLAESSAAAAAASARLRAAEAKLNLAERKLSQAKQQLATARALDQKLAAQLLIAEQKLAKANRELKLGQARVEHGRKLAAAASIEAYITGDPDLLKLKALLGVREVDELIVQLQGVATIQDHQQRELQKLRLAEVELSKIKQQVAASEQVIAANRAEAAQNLAQQTKLAAIAEAAAVQVTQWVQVRARVKQEAEASMRADRKQLAALEIEQARIKNLIKQRENQNQGGYQGSKNGFLLRPVSGEVTSPFGWRHHPIYGYWGMHDGVDFRTNCGEPMLASGNGTVISSYYSDVWGDRLVLDLGNVNGRNVSVIYNHATSYRVGVGAKVARGDVVGYAGNTGWSTGCHLHFTVMSDGNPVDPMPWF